MGWDRKTDPGPAGWGSPGRDLERKKEWERNSAHEKEKQQIEMQAVLDECQRKVETSDTLASAELVKKIQDLENQRAKLETESRRHPL